MIYTAIFLKGNCRRQALIIELNGWEMLGVYGQILKVRPGHHQAADGIIQTGIGYITATWRPGREQCLNIRRQIQIIGYMYCILGYVIQMVDHRLSHAGLLNFHFGSDFICGYAIGQKSSHADSNQHQRYEEEQQFPLDR
ncbi:hypothetical protein D3C72_1882940 [compost metagenome]